MIKIKKYKLYIFILLLIFLFFILVSINTKLFFSEKDYSPMKLFHTDSGRILREYTAFEGNNPIKAYEETEKYPIKTIFIEFGNSFEESRGNIKIVFENNSIGDFLWDYNNFSGEYKLNRTRVEEYRKINGPDFLFYADFFEEGYLSIDAPFWSAQPSVKGKLDSIFNRVSYDEYELKYYSDDEFTNVPGTNYGSSQDYEIILKIPIPEKYSIEDLGDSSKKQIIGYTVLINNLKYGEALRILVVDKNKKSTKEFINFLLTVLIIPLLIEIILEVRRYKK